MDWGSFPVDEVGLSLTLAAAGQEQRDQSTTELVTGN